MPQCDLSILCVTRMEDHAWRYVLAMDELAYRLGAQFVLAVDGEEPFAAVNRRAYSVLKSHLVKSQGYIESVLDEAIELCSRDFILRLDDDEQCSAGMVRWLEKRAYETANLWKFPRVHLWGDEAHALVTPHLWPDVQTRLSIKRYAGGRRDIHSGSPYGGGIEAPCSILHAKFIAKTLEQRREIVERYERIQEGAGASFRAFSCPEDFYKPEEMASSVRGWDGETFARRAA